MEVSVAEIRAFLQAKRKALEEDKAFLYRVTGTDDDHAVDAEGPDHDIDPIPVPKKDCDNSALSDPDSPKSPRKRPALNELNQLLGCDSKTDDFYDAKFSKKLKKFIHPNIAMLKTGEYSPNNPDMAVEFQAPRGGDVFLGLGLYEERRKKLLQKRQIEYREYLAKQTQMKSLQKLNHQQQNKFLDNDDVIQSEKLKEAIEWTRNLNDINTNRRPSSVAVQTDEFISNLTENKQNKNLPQESSLVPSINSNATDWRMHVEKVNIGTQNNLIVPPPLVENKNNVSASDNVSSSIINKDLIKVSDKNKIDYLSDYVNQLNDINKGVFRKDSPRARLLQDLSHTYMPSLFDAEAIRQRNIKKEEEAAAKRATYQMELKKQIEEQQRIREERKAREKLLEEAETRRLEEQLKMLKLAQESEIEKQKELSLRMRSEAIEFERRRIELQNEAEKEYKNLKDLKSYPSEFKDTNKFMNQSKSKNSVSKNENTSQISPKPLETDIDLLSYNVKRNNPYVGQDMPKTKLPFSSSVPYKPPFSHSIPVKNFNSRDAAPVTYSMQRHSKENRSLRLPSYSDGVIRTNAKRPNYEPAFLSKKITDMIEIKGNDKSDRNLEDSLPIPVLRESDKMYKTVPKDFSPRRENISEAMKNVERKWQVPAVQKNILKNNYTEDGKQENILTQLGSIRKQLQLEQLKLDQHFYSKSKLVK